MLVSPDQVPLVPEASVALRALMGLLLGSRRHIGGVMVEVLMPLEQLLLPEALITLITLIGLLVSVNQHVALQMTLRNGAVRAQVTLEALLSLVGLLVHFQGVPEKYIFCLHIVYQYIIYFLTCPGSFSHTFCNASASR